MKWLDTISLRFRSLFGRNAADHELDNELRFHLDRQIAENIAKGMPADQARCAALREFGGVDQIREECSDMRNVNWLQDFVQDVRYGLRMLRKSPGFAAVAILTLALGIGANTAIFSVVYAVVLRPLPYPNPSQLVFLFPSKPQEGIKTEGASYDNFTEWRAQNHVFAELAGITAHELTLTGRGEPSTVRTSVVTPELFSLLEVRPLVGRTFLPDDGQRGAAPVVILSENLWRGRLGADPNIIGSAISLDKRSFTVVGIMPADFRFPQINQSQQVWICVAQDPLFSGWMARPGLRLLGVTGRLKPGVSLSQAQAEMDAISARLAKKFPAENAGWIVNVAPLQEELVGSAKSALLVLLGAVGLVLLIACANISNLLLARATSRGKEIAVRTALGAGRRRIVRQLLTESALLGLLGGVAGVLLAYWGVRAIGSPLASTLPQLHAIRVDSGVLAFALLLSIAASFTFGLAPALFATDSSLQTSLNESTGRSSEAAARRFARSFLTVGEIALAMVLLVAAGLLVRSFATLTSVSPGFNVQHLVKADVSLPQSQYSKPEQWSAFSDELLRRLEAQPGLRDSAIAVPLPLNPNGSVNLPFEIMDNQPVPKGIPVTADYVSVSPKYFRVMGIPLLRGREFRVQDNSSAPRVTLISEELAHEFFPNQNPLGKQLIFGFPPGPGVPREIVGIVGDVRDASLGKDPGPMMYVPFDQAPFWGGEVVVKSDLSPASIAAVIRHEVSKVDKDLPVTDVESMSSLMDAVVAAPRLRTWLLASFGGMALLLAGAGIFGVISYSVSRRIHEIGIRIALGATPMDVLRLILTESAKLIALGLAIGSVAALALGRFLSNMLFTVRAADPLTFIVVAALLALVALAASYIPTRRAMRVDPMVALRHE